MLSIGLRQHPLSAGEGRMVTLAAQGQDGGQRNDGTRETAIEATIQDVDFLQVTAPNGSIDVLVQSSDNVTVGNPAAIGLGTSIPMLAAGDVKIRTTGGSLANNVAVFDAPSAGSAAVQFDKALLGNDLSQVANWVYDPGDEGIRASFIQSFGNGLLPADLGLKLGDRVLFLSDNNVVPVPLNNRGGLDHDSADPWPVGREITDAALVFRKPLGDDQYQSIKLYESDQVTEIEGDSRPNWKPVALYEKDGDKFLVWRNDWLESSGTLQDGSNIIEDIEPRGLTVGQFVKGEGINPGTFIAAINEPSQQNGYKYQVELSQPVSLSGQVASIANSIVRFEAASQQFAVWPMADFEGGFSWDGTESLLPANSTEAYRLEETYGIEINDDNQTGLLPIESDGITRFGVDASGALYAGGYKLLVDGRNVSSDFYTGFTPIAAESIDAGNFVVWQSESNTGIVVWLMDSQWMYQRTEIAPRPGSNEFFAFEEAMKTDLNGDGLVGRGQDAVASSAIRTDRSGVLRVGGYAISRNSVDVREDTYPKLGGHCGLYEPC